LRPQLGSGAIERRFDLRHAERVLEGDVAVDDERRRADDNGEQIRNIDDARL
jgi:hypothetical protein